MFATATLTLFLGVTSVLGGVLTDTSISGRSRCGTYISKEKLAAAEKHFRDHKVPPSTSFLPEEADPINVYFHVIYANETIDGGFVPEQQLLDQMDVLNKAYASTGLSFNLANITLNQNETWFLRAGPDGDEQTDMKEQLRIGDASDLNVYTTGFVDLPEDDQGLLGYATFPSDYEDFPKDDGVVMLYSSLPGGSTEGFNLGHTLTHEAGHWVGLYHTFEGGCTGVGDEVDDTPPEATPASGCPVGRDTCTGGGVDPIHNFMDYSQDSCMEEFSPGQATRLQAQVRTYRGISV